MNNHFKNMTQVKEIVFGLGIALMLLLGFSNCSCDGDADKWAKLTPEERRLMKSQEMDSVSIGASLHLDSAAIEEKLSVITAEAWMVIDDSTNLVISSRNANMRLQPASLTKMMTCLLALEKGNMDDTVRIENDECMVKDARVRPDDSYLMGTLVREMMLQSDNNAASALAMHLGGSIQAFCDSMNAKAAYLGLSDTHFANPNGLTNDSNYTSARDLLVLARYCMRDSTFASIVCMPDMKVRLIDGRHFNCENSNQLLKNYEGCTGIKTGYTSLAGGCLVVSANRNGAGLITVVLKSKSKATRFTEASLLLDFGFDTMAAYKEKTVTAKAK